MHAVFGTELTAHSAQNHTSVAPAAASRTPRLPRAPLAASPWPYAPARFRQCINTSTLYVASRLCFDADEPDARCIGQI
eukprot:6192141-Pleurochrysis_carterae.AAC.2